MLAPKLTCFHGHRLRDQKQRGEIMKSIVVAAIMAISTQALAGHVTCDIKGSPTSVKVVIASTNIASGDHTILITANGMMESTYELTPISATQTSFLTSIKAFSDIGYFIRQLPEFEINPSPKPKIKRVVEAQLDLETIDAGQGFLTNQASGNGKLTLTGDLSGAYPRLSPQYELENCIGELN